MSEGRVVIVDYGAGNLRSVAKAFAHVATGRDFTVTISSNAADLAEATHIVLPGVGAFGDCMAGLSMCPGMIEALTREALEGGKPFLGICVGMQLLFERGTEHGDHQGLGWFKGTVRRIVTGAVSGPEGQPLKVPHMGWNELTLLQDAHPIFAEMPLEPHGYFVHSYHATDTLTQEVLATTHYGDTIVAMVGRDNLVATQFHPEKSQEAGLCLLRNFLQMA